MNVNASYEDLPIYVENVRVFKLDLNHMHEEFYKTVKDASLTKSNNREWYCNTYSTINNMDLRSIPSFATLIEIAEALVSDYSKAYGVVGHQAVCTDAWLNLAKKGDYQEFHNHEHSHFSLVYYVKTPPDCGRLIFRNHVVSNDMFSIESANCNFSPLSYKTYLLEPVEGSMVIFRSNLQHMVEANRSDEDRVSIAMNMIIKDTL